MEVLDLNNLTIKQVKRLNEISESIKEDFNNLTEIILDETDKSLAWLLHPLVSRNPYQSNLFLNICYILLTKEIIDNNKTLEKIIPKNKIQQISIEKYLQKIGNNIKVVKAKKTNYLIYSLLASLYRIIRKVLLYVFTHDNKRTRTIKSLDSIILLDTFILQNSLKEGRYLDRYYPRLSETLEQSERERLYFLPTILGKFNRRQLKDIWKNSKENIIYKHDFLKIKDYIVAFIALLKLSLGRKTEYVFYDMNVSPLVIDEYKKKRFHGSAFEGLLNYLFISRLKKANVNLKLMVDWNENQPIDKGLIKGMKTFYPKVHTKGYQGYIISTDFNFYIQPTDYEIDNGVIPDEICVVGQGLEENVKKFSSKLKASKAPAFRFSNVYKEYGHNKSKSTNVLVALPIGMNESIDIIQVLSKAISNYDNIEFNIQIKPHPALKLNKLKELSGDAWLKCFDIVEGDFNEILASSSILIGSTSTTLIESLARGIPVIVVGSQKGITQNPIPKEIKEDIWTLCYTPGEIAGTIDFYTSYKHEKIEEHKKLGREIRAKYFEPVTKEGVRKFLELPNE